MEGKRKEIDILIFSFLYSMEEDEETKNGGENVSLASSRRRRVNNCHDYCIPPFAIRCMKVR